MNATTKRPSKQPTTQADFEARDAAFAQGLIAKLKSLGFKKHKHSYEGMGIYDRGLVRTVVYNDDSRVGLIVFANTNGVLEWETSLPFAAGDVVAETISLVCQMDEAKN